jgi:transmembrane sensor
MTSPFTDLDYLQHPDYELCVEASDWLLRLHNTQPDPEDLYCDPEKRNAAFLEWIRRSPKHVAMFLDNYEVYQRLGNIDPQSRLHIDALLGDRQQSDCAVRVASRRSHLPSVRAALTTLAFGLAALFALILRVHFAHTASTGPFHYTTRVGERKYIPLEDGSTIDLNTNSDIWVTFDPDERKVHLVQGEMLAHVRHEQARRFVVESDDLKVYDLGTQFDIYQHRFGARVSVIEGRVQVSCACGPAAAVSKPRGAPEGAVLSAGARSVSLSGGERLDFTKTDKGGILQRRAQTPEDLERAIAWKEGHLSFRGEPLSEVVQEFNRYNARQFVIADPSIARRPFAGFFPHPDPDRLIEELQEELNIRALREDSQNPNVITLVGSP